MSQASSQSHFDLIVIGSGPAGEVGAIRAAQLGLKTALVEKQAHLGGTCLNWGCIPTKALLESAKTYDKLKHIEELGFQAGPVSYQWDKILSRKNTIVDQQRKGLRFLMKKNKIECFEALGKIKDKNTVVLEHADGTQKKITAKNILLCTGSKIRELPFVKANGTSILNSDYVLSIPKIPKSLCVMGGGVVGMEFASLFARFGAEVTVLELGAQILPSEDEEVVKEFTRLLKKQSVTIHTSCQVTSVQDKGGGEVQVKTADGKDLKFEVVLLSVGREPVSQGIGLENVGIRTEKNFVMVDEHYRTNVNNIYAVGDLIPTPALAHTASAEAIHAVEVMAGHHPPLIDYKANPNAIYTSPEIASIGDTEKTLQAKKTPYKVAKFPFAPMAKAKIENASDGFIKILYGEKYKEILGVHIIHARATEMIAEFSLCKNLEGTLDDIGFTIHPHPTLSETIMETAHAGMGGAIHM